MGKMHVKSYAMLTTVTIILGLILTSTAALACSKAPSTAPRADDSAGRSKGFAMNEAQGGTEQSEGVADLPYARGRTFRTLDEYLVHLRDNGAIDLPWWREVSPGVYELQTSMRTFDGQSERATRAELMRRYGFTR